MTTMALFLLFIFKLADSSIGTLKNIFMIKNMSFLSAVSSAISYLFYILLMKQLLTTTNVITISVTLVAVFLGQYLSQIAANKMDKARIWKVSITPKTRAMGKEIADKLKEENIAVKTYSCYTDEMVKVLGVEAFSETKSQSIVINEILKGYDAKYSIVEIKNRF